MESEPRGVSFQNGAGLAVKLVAAEAAAAWLDRILGSMRDIPTPDFEEFLEYCRAARGSDRPRDDAVEI